MFEPVAQATIANRYRLVREIGRGGMGAVWEAFDIELDAPCALKFILNQSVKPPDIRARFLREARAVARLQSPHVVNIRSVGEWQGTLYIAMELLIGETLFDRLTRTGTLTPRDTSRVVDQVASVLTASHAAGVVHRDLKPENVWLWSHPDIFVKVLDFGVAKQVEADNPLLKTATGMLVGTPYYMSPEQAAGDRHVDHRSDVWSLAIIAAECLGGRRPFQATGLGQLLASIISGPTPGITELYPASTPALAAWWALATAKDPKDRYPSAQAMADGLAVALGLRSVSEHRTSPDASPNGLTDERTAAAPQIVLSREPLAATSSLSPVTALPQNHQELTTDTSAAPPNLFDNPAPPRPAPLLETLPTPAPSVSPLVPSSPVPSRPATPIAANPTAKWQPAVTRLAVLAALAVVAVGAALWLGRARESDAVPAPLASPNAPPSFSNWTAASTAPPTESSSHRSDPSPQTSSMGRVLAEPDASTGSLDHATSPPTLPKVSKPQPKPAVTPKPKARSKPPAPSLEKRIGF